MSGIAGIVSCERRVDSEIDNITAMAEALSGRGKTSVKIKSFDHGIFGCTDLLLNCSEEKRVPFTMKVNNIDYTVCFDGLIYNSDEIKAELKMRGIDASGADDAELVLLSYLRWGAGCLNRINGIFAFSVWNSECGELFVARDRFGIKPLYYSVKNNCFIFASEIKGILANSNIDAVIDKTGVCEILGLGPAHTQGCGVFKDIYEVLPGHFAVYNSRGFNEHGYWKLESKKYECSFEECLDETKRRVFDAVDSQLNEKGRNIAFFLSGGVDSSAITALAARHSDERINTFSLKYKDNDDYFKPTEYQPESDDYYIEMVKNMYNTDHNIITVDTESLVKHLTDAVDCRDLPGMADVDSSLYYLCKQMGSSFNGALSGECADEVFGGYPWFHRKSDFDAKIFPWSKDLDFREGLVSPELLSPKQISEYVYSMYNKSIAKVPLCDSDTPEEKRRREISHLNIEWFMYTLGVRSERIGMNCGLEIRMPFCDYKLVEYVWNIPWKFKNHNDREKGLLRQVFDGVLPDDVLWRKKSPFPKTHNPEYEYCVKNMVREIFDNKNSRINDIINKKYIEDIMLQPSDYGKPWFGQLMATPQLYAYIIQLEYWLNKYNVIIKP